MLQQPEILLHTPDGSTTGVVNPNREDLTQSSNEVKELSVSEQVEKELGILDILIKTTVNELEESYAYPEDFTTFNGIMAKMNSEVSNSIGRVFNIIYDANNEEIARSIELIGLKVNELAITKLFLSDSNQDKFNVINIVYSKLDDMYSKLSYYYSYLNIDTLDQSKTKNFSS